MKSDKELKREDRGTYDFTSDGNVFALRWHDNAVVSLASNHLTHEPVMKTKRRTKRGTKEVDMPNIVAAYNSGMGGVDLLNRLCSSYRPNIYAKRWWWPLFTHALNVSVVAAWRLYQALHPESSKSHLDFRRTITNSLMQNQMNGPTRNPSSGRRHVDLPAAVRFSGIGHNKVTGSQGRCVLCNKNTFNWCDLCKKRLHYSRGKRCFDIYHTQ